MATLAFFHAHPDDEAISTGGTMAILSDAGHKIVLVLATKGELGEVNEGMLSQGETLADRRVAELRTSADVLGVHVLDFLGYRDSGMVNEASNDDERCFWQADIDEAAQRLAAILQEHDVDILVGYDPNGTYGHPDHVQVHRVGERAAEMVELDRVFWATANRDVIQQAIDDGAFGEQTDEEFDERMDRTKFGMPMAELTHAVDVRAAIERKRAALRAHQSQIDEQSFFSSMPDDVFAVAFGTEWFVDARRFAASQQRQGELVSSLFE